MRRSRADHTESPNQRILLDAAFANQAFIGDLLNEQFTLPAAQASTIARTQSRSPATAAFSSLSMTRGIAPPAIPVQPTGGLVVPVANGGDVAELAALSADTIVPMGTPRSEAVMNEQGGFESFYYGEPPEAYGDAFSTLHDLTLSEPAPGVLGNDDDPWGTSMTAALETAPGPGDLTLNSDGSFIYTPPEAWIGNTSFTYRAVNEYGASEPATVIIGVLNAKPEAYNDGVYHATAGVELLVDAPGVLANDFPVDSDSLYAVLATPPSYAQSFTLNPDGSFSYTPSSYQGPDHFTYYANDGLENSEFPATVDLYVWPRPDLDVATIAFNAPSGVLDDALEDTEGAYAPVNDDDDPFGENDLVPAYLNPIDPISAGGTYSLSIPANMAVWLDDQGTIPVTEATEFDATIPHTVYVEGLAYGSGVLTAVWQDPDQMLQIPDTVTFHFYTHSSGAWSVVEHGGHYYYAAIGGMPGAGNSKWLAPVNGTEHHSGDSPDAGGVDMQWIDWGAGPAWGKVRYQAAPNYTYEREVAIVQIKITDSERSCPFYAQR